MCQHKSTTVVTGGKLNVHQCDFCGATLWWMDVDEDVIAAAIDVEAMKMWEQRADEGLIRDENRRIQLKATNPKAYREEVKRMMGKIKER